jgi:hypothetical protein
VVQRRAPVYDKGQDGHYNLISALHKAVRGSDPDAALYYLARMFDAGEDPLFLGRRLVRMASEDIGLPTRRRWLSPMRPRMPMIFWARRKANWLWPRPASISPRHPNPMRSTPPTNPPCARPRKHGSLLPPKHILNAPTKLMKSEGYSDGYLYDHDQPDAFSGQDYFPEAMGRRTFYDPPERALSATSASGSISGRGSQGTVGKGLMLADMNNTTAGRRAFSRHHGRGCHRALCRRHARQAGAHVVFAARGRTLDALSRGLAVTLWRLQGSLEARALSLSARAGACRV